MDEPTHPMDRLSMAGSAYGFRAGRHNVYQALLAKLDEEGYSGLPLIRADCYTP